MSADNWRTCPQCLASEKTRKAKEEQEASEKYGKISAEEWQALIVKSRMPIELDETFREDYEFYMNDDGVFTAEYYGRCECGFEHKFKHSENVNI